MKKILKLTLLLSFALITQNQIWANLLFSAPFITLIKVALVLSFFEIILKPIIKILLFPINLLTLGLFRIVINTVGFYLAAFILSDFTINSINTPITTWQGITFPAIYLTGFWAHLVNSTSNSFLLYIFRLILKTQKDKK
jgi:putative membrane protein